MRRLLFLTCLLAAAASPVRAEDATPPADGGLEADVARFLAARDRTARTAAADAIAGRKPDPARVAALLAAGRAPAKDAATGWQARTHRGPDGVERAWLLFVPRDYDPAKRHPLWVDLHGGVSRPQSLTHDELGQMKFFWGEEAERRGFLLAIPAGQAGAEWWTENGAGNVLGILAEVKREYAVDVNRVVATGFSDGGSGCFYLGLAHPTPFAAFVPLNGHVGVAGIGGLQVHVRNLANKPFYAVNTDRDSLYPSAAIRPVADAVKGLGAPFTWREILGFAHDPSYLATERDPIRAWVGAQRRVPHPDRVVWEGTEDQPSSRVHWLDRVKVADRGEAARFPDVNPALPPGRVRLGITLDPEFAGPGVLVKAVQEGSAAAGAGVAPGDRIVGLDGADVTDPQTLRAALEKKAHGDPFKIRLARGEETSEKEGRFPAAGPEPAFPRRKPFGTVEVRRSGNAFDVTCANVASFDLLLGVGAVDLGAPVVVRVNGAQAHGAKVAPDLSVLLDYAAEDDDPEMLYAARLTVAVPAPAPAPR